MFTGKYCQLVVMCLQAGEEIENEVHPAVDQFFRIEEGEAKFVLNGKKEHLAHDGDAVVVPAGTYHNVINTSKTKTLKLYTVYSPPNHPDETVHKTKAEAEGPRNKNTTNKRRKKPVQDFSCRQDLASRHFRSFSCQVPSWSGAFPSP